MRKLSLKKWNSFIPTALLLLLTTSLIFAQAPTIKSIEKELLSEAHAVIRNYETRVDIINAGKAVVSEEYTVTILKNENQLATYFTLFGYDKHDRINHLSLILYDALGNVEKKFKKKDFVDQAAYDGISVFTDNRMLYYPIHELEPPFSFSVSIEKELDQLMSVRSYMPVKRSHVSMEKGKLTIVHDTDFEIKYLGTNIGQPQRSIIDDKTSLEWEVKNVAAVHHLSGYDEPLHKIVPSVDWEPLIFEFGGYTGGFDSWKSFGSWLAKLGVGTQNLPEEAMREINALVTDDMTDTEKVKAVYSFLQDRSRYVSIQLGIGGFKPFDAAAVHESQYGDCKALSNYTQALLEEVGVRSFYTVIHAGRDGKKIVNPQYPSSSFNHAVLIVPLAKDTILLECTSQDNPCGYRSTFTDDRYALAIADGEGRLIKTPAYSLDENIQVDSIQVSLDENQLAYLSSRSTLKGRMAEINYLLAYPVSDQRKWLSDQLAFGQFDIKSHDIKLEPIANWNYQIVLTTDLQSNNFANKSGKRIFIPSAIFHEFGQTSLPDSMQYAFNLNSSYQYKTHVSVDIPEGYKMESELIETEIENDFGKYTISYALDQAQHKLFIDRSLVILEGHYPKEVFLEYKDFRKRIKKIENDEIVLVEVGQ